MERRTFLKTVAVGLGASMIGTESLAQTAPDAQPAKKVIVAGAGVTGLCCAYELMQRGIDVTVFEASGRYGGHVYTGHDGLSDGLFADYGADHLTKPGYEQFFRYVDAFGLKVVPYPNAEGSPLPANNGQMTMIGGKFYSETMLADPATQRALGFNDREIAFLASHPWYELPALFLADHLARFHDAFAVEEVKRTVEIERFVAPSPVDQRDVARRVGGNGRLADQYRLTGVVLAPRLAVRQEAVGRERPQQAIDRRPLGRVVTDHEQPSPACYYALRDAGQGAVERSDGEVVEIDLQ